MWLLDDAIAPEAERALTSASAQECCSPKAKRSRSGTSWRVGPWKTRFPRRVAKACTNLVIERVGQPRLGVAAGAYRPSRHARRGNRAAVLKYAPVAAQAGLQRWPRTVNRRHIIRQHSDTPTRLRPNSERGYSNVGPTKCHLTGQIEEAFQARRAALELWRRLGDARRQGENLRWMSRITWGLARKEGRGTLRHRGRHNSGEPAARSRTRDGVQQSRATAYAGG